MGWASSVRRLVNNGTEMPTKRRLVTRFLFVIPLILLLLVVILVSREWEAPELGRAVLARQAALGGVELDVSNVRFHVLKGIRLAGVRARLGSPGGEMVAEMEVLELKHRLGPFLAGRVEIDELRLVRPVIHLLAPGDSAPAGAGAQDDGQPRTTPAPPGCETGPS